MACHLASIHESEYYPILVSSLVKKYSNDLLSTSMLSFALGNASDMLCQNDLSEIPSMQNKSHATDENTLSYDCDLVADVTGRLVC